MVQLQLKRLGILIALVLTTCISYGQGPPRLRFTQLPQADSIGSILITDSDRNLQFTNNLRYLNSVFSVTGDVNFDSGTLFVDATNNRVGIGTSTPSKTFIIEKNADELLSFAANNTNTGTASRIRFEMQNGPSSSSDIAYMQLYGSNFSSPYTDLFLIGNNSGITGGMAFWPYNSKLYMTASASITDGSGVTINSSNNLGIGTTSPSNKLSVAASLSKTLNSNGWGMNVIDMTSGGNAGVGGAISFTSLRSDGGQFNSGAIAGSKSNSSGLDEKGDLVFYSGSGTGGALAERMRILWNGNVGIGTNPVSKFHVSDASSSITLRDYLNGATIFLDGSDGDFIGGDYFHIIANGNSYLGLGGYGGGITPLNITYTGNVGIGTTLPNAKLDISNGSVTGSIRLGGDVNADTRTDNTRKLARITAPHYDNDEENIFLLGADIASENLIVIGGGGIDNNAATVIAFYTAANNTTLNGTQRMRITSGGEVYIAGTTDRGSYNLQVNGTGVWGQGSYVNGSDIKLKENIKPINSGLYYVNKLKPVEYNYKPIYSSDPSRQLGFIAQDVIFALEDLSDAVVKDNGDIYSMAYQNLIPLAVKAIQEQQAIIETQNTRITELETALQALITRVEQLENQ